MRLGYRKMKVVHCALEAGAMSVKVLHFQVLRSLVAHSKNYRKLLGRTDFFLKLIIIHGTSLISSFALQSVHHTVML